ncbi:MAG: hypothetical protein JSR46_10475 [Verrucomicrobia bacterium]|nr:hypothetical protein [Verrucomicrobiota bacterium]
MKIVPPKHPVMHHIEQLIGEPFIGPIKALLGQSVEPVSAVEEKSSDTVEEEGLPVQQEAVSQDPNGDLIVHLTDPYSTLLEEKLKREIRDARDEKEAEKPKEESVSAPKVDTSSNKHKSKKADKKKSHHSHKSHKHHKSHKNSRK